MSASDTTTRLYVDVPANALSDLSSTGHLLDRFASRLDIACINIQLDKSFGPNPELDGFIAARQQKNIAVLADLTAPVYLENRKSLEKALEKIANAGFDGAHMSAEPPLFERARQVLASDAIIGCACGTSKHQAMLMGEAGADYVALDPVHANPDNLDAPPSGTQLIEWWQDLFEVPCIAANVVDQAHIEALLQVGADFIFIGPAFWPKLKDDEKFLAWLAEKCPALAEVG